MIMENNIAKTKDILGEHLHQKIKEQVQNDFDDSTIGDDASLISKITGILLELPVEDILKMLMDKSLLQRSLKMAADSVRNGRSSGSRPNSEIGCTDDVSQLLYQKVSRLDLDLAPQITGILLEMDKETVYEMLRDESKFLQAFGKARSCVSVDGIEPSDEEDSLSIVIYQRAETLYKSHAPKITGMIMELDPIRLKQIISDKHSLDEAIKKAFGVLSASEAHS